MQIVLPETVAAGRLHFKTYAHPRTGRLAKFLLCDDSLYELTKVGSATRSALVHNTLKRDGTIHAATPLHPKFMIIRPLFENRSRALPLDVILELGAVDDADDFPSDIAVKHASHICSVESGLYKLDLRLLQHFLDACVAVMQDAIPAGLRNRVMRCIQPVDPRESPAPELVDQANEYAAVSFVASSWLHPAVAEWYMATHDFSQLETAVTELHRFHVESQAHQFADLAYKPPQAGQRTSSTPAPKPVKQKRQLPVATNNKSLLQMFQPRQAKKSRSGP